MLSKNFYRLLWPAIGVITAFSLSAQSDPTMTVAPQPTVKVKKGSAAPVTVKASLPAGFHCNSNTPSEPYLIPLKLTWGDGPLKADSIEYPKGKLEKYSFSDKPLSVLTGEIDITTRFKVPADAPAGVVSQSGKLRYQACNDRACFAPKTVNVNLTVNVE